MEDSEIQEIKERVMSHIYFRMMNNQYCTVIILGVDVHNTLRNHPSQFLYFNNKTQEENVQGLRVFMSETKDEIMVF